MGKHCQLHQPVDLVIAFKYVINAAHEGCIALDFLYGASIKGEAQTCVDSFIIDGKANSMQL